MDRRQKMVERCKHALALAKSTNHQGEHLIAMAMVRKMMLRFEIEEHELEDTDNPFGTMDTIEIKTGKLRWKRLLTAVIGEYLGLTSTYSPRSMVVTMYGQGAVMDAFKWCYELAMNEIERLSKPVERHRRNNYRLSMVVGIQDCIQEHENATPQETGIVKHRLSQANDYMLSKVKLSSKKQRKWTYARNQDAYSKGQGIGSKIKGHNKVIGEQS